MVRISGGLRAVGIVFAKEVRCLLRDRQTVVYSLVVPLFLYPAVILGLLQGISYVRGVQERRSVVAGVSGDATATRIRERLTASGRVHAVEFDMRAESARYPSPSQAAGERNVDGEPIARAARRAIVDGRLDAVVVCEGSGPWIAGSPDFRLEVYHSEALDGSREARDRLLEFLDDYRVELLADLARGAGRDERFLDALEVESVDLSTGEEFTNYVAGLTLPLLMVIMLALGALYPALDTCVGEKERRSLETTLLSPIRRSSIVLGKYLAVTSFSLLAFSLNFGSMALTISHLGLQAEHSMIHLGLWSVVVISIAAVLLAVFLSAVVMLLAFLAQSFKEGQAYVTPVYMLALVTALLTSSPESSLTPAAACVPVVNLVLLVRVALNAEFAALPITVSIVSSSVYAAAALWAAARVLSRESVLIGGQIRLRSLLSLFLGRESVTSARAREGRAS